MINIKSHVRPVLKLLAERFGLISPLAKEMWALKTARLDVQARLTAGPGRVAIVGCGSQGRAIARATKLLANWSVAAICDQRPEALKSMQAEMTPEAASYNTLEALLSHASEWDVLAIATWAPTHVSIALSALEAGVNKIMVEKPLATGLADADTLIDAAAKAGTTIAVDHIRRWNSAGEGLRRLIDSGVIGELRAINCVFGRSGFANIGTHLFDFVRWLAKADIVKIRAELEQNAGKSWLGDEFVDPSGRCEGRLSNGVRFTIDLSHDCPLQQNLILLVGEHGRLEVDERLCVLRLVGLGERVWEKTHVWPQTDQVGVASLILELHAGNTPRCTLKDGRAALEAAIACQLSAREEGRWITFPLNGEVCNEQFPFA